MQPKVTAVLVARNGAQYLPTTLASLAAQVRRPDSVIYVDAKSSDASRSALAAAASNGLVVMADRGTFGGAVAHGVRAPAIQAGENDWLWLLGHDNAPHPRALSALLAAVEVAPSVAVAGPKLMRWDSPDTIAAYGESMTPFGHSVPLATDELDQAQFDLHSDLLAVSAGGMLVRRQVWAALGGFDPGLPSTDAALDFCVRARLAGHRVIGVPSARVASAGPAELFGKRSLSAGAQNRIRRSAQLHRRLVYAPAITVPLHWLTLLPLAILRSLVHLVAKRPGVVGGEFAASLGAAFDGSVPRARAKLRRNRVLGWASVGALRLPWSDVRERRAHDRAAQSAALPVRAGPGFFAGGGAWVVLLAALTGALAFGRVASSTALEGGGLAPLSSTVAALWSHIGYGWRDNGAGFTGAADPFSYLLGVLGSVTFWSPSASVVALYVIAIPLSALGAWWCVARMSVRPWAPAIAAAAWAVAPPLLASLSGGHLGAVIAHVLLPFLVLSALSASRSWSAAAVAALLFAAVGAGSPVLVPAMLAAWVAVMVLRPTGIHRLAGIPVPAAALFVPLIVQQSLRGNLVALVADPGVPVLSTAPTGWQLAFGSTDATLAGWHGFLSTFGMPPHFAVLAIALFAAPLALLAILALFVPSSRRAVPALLLALAGFATAVVSGQLQVTIVGSTTTPVWSGSGLSLYWFGLVVSAAAAIEVLGRRAALASVLAGIGAAALAVPLIVAAASGSIAVTGGNGRLLPAFVTAEAAASPRLGTLELTGQAGGTIAVTVHRGQGTTLDARTTLHTTSVATSDADARLATLAGNISSRSGFDVAGELSALQLPFVLVPHSTDPAAAAARTRITDALNGNRILTPIGDTANGYLWHFDAIAPGTAPGGPGPAETPLGVGIIVGQAVVFGLTLLLAVPSTRRRRVRATRADARSASSAAGTPAVASSPTSAATGASDD